MFVANNYGSLGLMEIASGNKLDKSTAARLLQTLEGQALLNRDTQTRRYSIGPGLLSLAAAVSKKSDLLRVVRPYLEKLRDETGETVSLYVRSGDERVCVDGFESFHSIRRVLPLGESVPLYRGSAGKVILALLPHSEIVRITAVAAGAGVDPGLLQGQLEQVREQGFLALTGDRLPEASTLSVALSGPSGVVGSITIAGPAERWSRDRMRSFAPRLIEWCDFLSEQLAGAAR